MRKSPIKYIVFPIVFLLTSSLISCYDNYTLCDQSLVVNANGNFYSSGLSGSLVLTPPAQLTVTGITGNPIVPNAQSPVSISLGLSPNTDSTKFIFSLGASPKDTITFYYSTEETVLSQNCGSIKTNTLSKVKTTGHTIDSVALVNREVANRLALNVSFYY